MQAFEASARTEGQKKLLTVVVPCYNSAAYMENAVNTLLPGGPEMDILLVDDGSKDDTGLIADRLAHQYPDRVRVIHQPNGGHGAGLNRGIETARGIYFKVLDSDDRLDPDGLKALLHLLREHASPDSQADLVVHDYTYDHGEQRGVFSMQYHKALPQGRMFGWEDCRRFSPTMTFLIHSLVYRTALLRTHDYRLPEHTFYEDNLYTYQPLPWTKRLMYLHLPVYGYNVGREDQSVNERNLIKRLDQLNNMITQMALSWRMKDLNALPGPLRQYMVNNVAAQIWSLSALHFIANTPESLEMNRKLWADIKAFDGELFKALTHTFAGFTARLPGKLGRGFVVGCYHLGHKLMHFG